MCAYEERVREVEHGCFTLLVFATSGMGREKLPLSCTK